MHLRNIKFIRHCWINFANSTRFLQNFQCCPEKRLWQCYHPWFFYSYSVLISSKFKTKVKFLNVSIFLSEQNQLDKGTGKLITAEWLSNSINLLGLFRVDSVTYKNLKKSDFPLESWTHQDQITVKKIRWDLIEVTFLHSNDLQNLDEQNAGSI